MQAKKARKRPYNRGMKNSKTFKPGDRVVAKHPLYRHVTRRLTVVSDEGGGWYMCEGETGRDLYHSGILSATKTPERKI